MPIPDDVDGAPVGPGLPGPTTIFTKHTSAVALGELGGGTLMTDSTSPFLKAFTSVTVAPSPRSRVLRLSSQARGARTAPESPLDSAWPTVTFVAWASLASAGLPSTPTG